MKKITKGPKKVQKTQVMSSTLSTQHELIKHECKVFPPSLIIIAMLVHLRIQLNLILKADILIIILQEYMHKSITLSNKRDIPNSFRSS